MAGSHDKHEQIERFRATAAALGCDEDREKFESALRKVATHKPSMKSAKKKRPDSKSSLLS
jgi:hypothetical protein